MHAVVVYESHWGNTAAVAEAIAQGIGEGTRAVPTDQAGPLVAEADLVVAGAPLIGFTLATDKAREGIATTAGDAPEPPDLDHPSMRSWLERLPAGHARSAAFDTKMRWSPGSATGTIERGLERAGYRPIARGNHFVVTGKYGPLRAGELERARRWGAELAHTVRVLG